MYYGSANAVKEDMSNDRTVRLDVVDMNDHGVDHRHHRGGNNTKRAGSKERQWLPRMASVRNLSFGQEEAFLNMQIRKMNRAMSGTKSRDTKYEYAALLLVLVLIFSGDAAQHYREEEADPGEEANDPGGGGRSWEGCRAAQ